MPSTIEDREVNEENRKYDLTKVLVPNDMNNIEAGYRLRVFDKASSRKIEGPEGDIMWVTAEDNYILTPTSNAMIEVRNRLESRGKEIPPEFDMPVLLNDEHAMQWFINNELLNMAPYDIRYSAIIC